MYRYHFKILLLLALAYISLSSYKTKDGSIYVGAWATCSDKCELSKNANCSGKCITFRDNTGKTKNIRQYQFLDEVCWQLKSCHNFPKFYSFQTDRDCKYDCEVNKFPGFSLWELKKVNQLYNAKGYNMMCIEYAYSGTKFPNICEAARPYAVLWQNMEKGITGIILLFGLIAKI